MFILGVLLHISFLYCSHEQVNRVNEHQLNHVIPVKNDWKANLISITKQSTYKGAMVFGSLGGISGGIAGGIFSAVCAIPGDSFE